MLETLRVAPLALVLAACGGSGGEGPEPGPYDGGPPPATCDDLFEGEPALELEIGRIADGAFTRWSDGDEIPFVWGPQGGTMIVPSVRADLALDPDDDTPCVSVEIANLEPAGGTAFEGFRGATFALTGSHQDGRVVVQDVFDQLGWIEIPRDTPLELEVVVRGRRAAARGRVALTIVPPGMAIPPECEALPVTGTGCRYRVVPATARVVRIGPASEGPGQCPAASDARFVETEVTIRPEYAACSTTTTVPGSARIAGQYLPSTACLESLGVVDGSTIDAELHVIFAGTCSPLIERVTGLDACLEACVGTP
ncbi:hypothetical protein [Sandaracinus amylolyticus]|uniref:hypothetical protein n=1 Tax=Sandaracinus amylolyticus TaxID=927083 RepID=UPI001F3EAD2B|nr:hypothetical protein [Sandaracinus amylolyticus]UJR86728.1 Hypothetical protein I5071_88290 [Sandaracinus amylolyticus]